LSLLTALQSRLKNESDIVNFTSAIKVTPLRTLEGGEGYIFHPRCISILIFGTSDPCAPAPELESIAITRELPRLEHLAFHCPSKTPMRTGKSLFELKTLILIVSCRRVAELGFGIPGHIA